MKTMSQLKTQTTNCIFPRAQFTADEKSTAPYRHLPISIRQRSLMHFSGAYRKRSMN